MENRKWSPDQRSLSVRLSVRAWNQLSVCLPLCRFVLPTFMFCLSVGSCLGLSVFVCLSFSCSQSCSVSVCVCVYLFVCLLSVSLFSLYQPPRFRWCVCVSRFVCSSVFLCALSVSLFSLSLSAMPLFLCLRMSSDLFISASPGLCCLLICVFLCASVCLSRGSVSLSFCLFISFPLCLAVCFSVSRCSLLSVFLSVSLCRFPRVSLIFIILFLCLFVCPFLCCSVVLFVSFSSHFLCSVGFSVFPSRCSFVSLSVRVGC